MAVSRRPRVAVATVTTLATISGAVVAAPSASAWTTSYDATQGKCTIAFTSSEQDRLNTAWKTVFASMAEHTDNAALKSSLAKAAEKNVLPTSTVTVTPAEARANDGFYGVDIYEVLLPGGLETAIENIGVGEIVANIDYDAALAQVDLTNVAKAIDWDKALDKDGDGSADVDTKAAIKALPLEKVVSNVDVGAVKQKLTVWDIIGVYNNPKANLPKVLERVDADKLLADALAKTDIDKEQTAKEVLKASGIEPDQVIQNVSKQQPVRDAVKAELNKVDYKTLLLDAMKKAGKEPSIDLVLGYNPSDVFSAAKEAFKEVGPAVTAPILTARPAFTSCSAPKDGQNEASTPSRGVVVPGSSLDLKGVAIVAVLGLVAALIASGVFGFAMRPAFDQLVAQLQ